MSQDRYFINPYNELNVDLSNFEPSLLKLFFDLFLPYESDKEKDEANFTIYTGISGYAFFYISTYTKLSNFMKSNPKAWSDFTQNYNKDKVRDTFWADLLPNLMKRSENYVKIAVKRFEQTPNKLVKDRISPFAGISGPYFVAILYYNACQNITKRETYINKYLDFYDIINDVFDRKLSTNYPAEILYGMSGYLLGVLTIHEILLKLDKNLSSEMSCSINVKMIHSVDVLIEKTTCIIKNLSDQIIVYGISYGKKHKSCLISTESCPLMFEWHEKQYLGAAHGIFGILYTLCCVILPYKYLTKKYETLICQTLINLAELQYPSSGNFPSSIPPKNDTLVQWCHGSPGVIFAYLKAAEIFPSHRETFLNIALKCGENVWNKGLLTKGYGLCHGVSGNGYALLALANCPLLTNEMKSLYLDRAKMFGDWLKSYGTHNCRIPDTPYSLFEGQAGVMLYILDSLSPKDAKFPIYQF